VVESRSHGRSASVVADCLSLVFHLVDSRSCVFTQSRAWLLMSVTSVLAYTPCNRLRGRGTAQEFSSMLSLEYGPVYLWLAYYCWAARRTKLSPGPQKVGFRRLVRNATLPNEALPLLDSQHWSAWQIRRVAGMFFGSRQSNGNRCIAVEGCLSDLIAVGSPKLWPTLKSMTLAINSIPIAPHPRER